MTQNIINTKKQEIIEKAITELRIQTRTIICQIHDIQVCQIMQNHKKAHEIVLEARDTANIIFELTKLLKRESEIARTKMFLTINNNKNALNYATHATNRTDEILDYITTLKQELALYL